MQSGVVRTASGGLAGSTLSLDAAVRNMVEHAGHRRRRDPYGLAAPCPAAGY
jgi:N-acetylglucosamine-6-phosphate deacetylase